MNETECEETLEDIVNNVISKTVANINQVCIEAGIKDLIRYDKGKNTSKNYQSLPINYLEIAKGLSELLNTEIQELKKGEENLDKYTTIEMEEYNLKAEQLIKQELIIKFDDNYKTFFNRNKHNLTHLTPKTKKDYEERITKKIKEFKEEYLKEYNKIKNIKKQIEQIQKRNTNSCNVLDVIEKLKQEEIYIETQEVDCILMDALENVISLNSALKEIRAKPKKEIKITPKTITIETEKKEKEEYSPKVYDEKQINYFLEKGINEKIAKNIIDEDRIEISKRFIESIETIFFHSKLNEKNVENLFKKSPEILELGNGDQTRYLDILSRVFETQDPTKISGIKPINRGTYYKTVEGLKELLPTKYEKTLVYNLELIKNKKTKKNVKLRLESNPFSGEYVEKNMESKGGEAKTTHLYNECKKLNNGKDGHFRKIKSGGKRTLVVIEHNTIENRKQAKILEFYNNHSEYERKLRLK